MATKKDLVEAYSFSRRRLVTAFVSGAPGGREVEPSRPGRSVIGGVALAVLILAGAAVTGVLKSPSTVDLSDPGLFTEKESGQPYILLAEGEPLRPVANITSAQLLLGPGLVPTQVKRSELAEKRPEATIGILGAPGTPPATDSLLPSGWTACTGADGGTSGIKVDVASTPDVQDEATKGFVVTSKGKRYLIAESFAAGRTDPRAYSYEIPQDAPDPILSALNVGNEGNEIEVPREWLVLFTVGGALDLASFGIDSSRLGKPSRNGDPLLPSDARVGDYVEAQGAQYLVTDDKSVELDPFAAAVYLDLDFPGKFSPMPLENDDRPGGITETRDLPGLNWPDRTLEPLTSGELCARLDAAPDQPPGARLASTLSGDASAAGIPFDDKDVTVEPGHGAVVLRGGWDSSGVAQPTLLDERGIAYSMIDDAAFRLGYGDVRDVVVPDQWIELFTAGVDLSVQAASCPPTSKPRAGPCGDGS